RPRLSGSAGALREMGWAAVPLCAAAARMSYHGRGADAFPDGVVLRRPTLGAGRGVVPAAAPEYHAHHAAAPHGAAHAPVHLLLRLELLQGPSLRALAAMGFVVRAGARVADLDARDVRSCDGGDACL